MKIIVGLGNPDKEYESTFHNLGFMCVDRVAEKLNMEFTKTKCKAKLSEGKVNGEKVVLVKPQTYMNLSGQSVREVLAFYKAELSDLLIVYDDFDLPKGALRIRESGSAGTHNGMKSVIKELGSGQFLRVRVGFYDNEKSQIPLVNMVLSQIKGEDKQVFDKVNDSASNAIIDFINGKTVQEVMQKYNLNVK